MLITLIEWKKFVEIKADGDSEKVTLLKGGGLLKLGGCTW